MYYQRETYKAKNCNQCKVNYAITLSSHLQINYSIGEMKLYQSWECHASN